MNISDIDKVHGYGGYNDLQVDVYEEDMYMNKDDMRWKQKQNQQHC